METGIGGAAMVRLLGHGMANGFSPSECALERGSTERQTSGFSFEIQLFAQRSGGGRRESGLPLKYVVRKRESALFWSVSLGAIPLLFGHCYGEYPYCALRHGVVLLSRFPPEQV